MSNKERLLKERLHLAKKLIDSFIIFENLKLEQQNKRYREAIEYVINAKVNQYASLENIINDIKFVLSEALESESHD